MESKKEEYVSLFEYLNKAAGSETGRLVYAAAKKANEPVKNRDVTTHKFKGKVLTYRREFLDIYFAIK